MNGRAVPINVEVVRNQAGLLKSRPANQEVVGSNPAGPANKHKGLRFSQALRVSGL